MRLSEAIEQLKYYQSKPYVPTVKKVCNIALETIEALQAENEQLRVQVARMRAALILDIKTTIPYEIVYCPKCKYSDFSKTIEYAYTCKNRLSPCRNRIAAANFGCTYGERKESDNDG